MRDKIVTKGIEKYGKDKNKNLKNGKKLKKS